MNSIDPEEGTKDTSIEELRRQYCEAKANEEKAEAAVTEYRRELPALLRLEEARSEAWRAKSKAETEFLQAVRKEAMEPKP